MAIPSIINSASDGGNNLSTDDVSLTVSSGSGRVLLGYFVSLDSSQTVTPSSVTFDPGGGNEASFTHETTVNNDYSGNRQFVSLWYLVLGDGVSGGSYTVRFTADEACTRFYCQAVEISGANTTDPIGATDTAIGNTDTLTDSVTTTDTNSLVVGSGCMAEEVTFTATSGTEVIDAGINLDSTWLGYIDAASISSYTVSAQSSDTPNNDQWSFVIAEILEAAATGVTVTPAAVTAVAASTGPSAVILGSITVSPSAGTGVAASVNPTVILGSITVTPTYGTGVVVSVNPTVVLGSTIATPSPGTCVATSVAPTVVLGSTTATPAAGTAVAAGVDPTVVIGGGGTTVTPDPVTGVVTSVNPTVVLGSITVAPAAVSAVGESVNPTVILGSLAITPAPVSMVGARVNPDVVLGSLSLSPSPVSGVTSTYDPTVILGSILIVAAATYAVGARAGPTVLLGSTTASPTAAYCVAARNNPTVFIGGGGAPVKDFDIYIMIAALKNFFKGMH